MDYLIHGNWPVGSRYKSTWLISEAFDLLLAVKTEEDKKGNKENGE